VDSARAHRIYEYDELVSLRIAIFANAERALRREVSATNLRSRCAEEGERHFPEDENFIFVNSGLSQNRHCAAMHRAITARFLGRFMVARDPEPKP